MTQDTTENNADQDPPAVDGTQSDTAVEEPVSDDETNQDTGNAAGVESPPADDSVDDADTDVDTNGDSNSDSNGKTEPGQSPGDAPETPNDIGQENMTGSVPGGVGQSSDLFYGYDSSNPSEIAEVLSGIEPPAGIAIEELIRENKRLRMEVGTQKERVEDIRAEFQRYKERKESQTETFKETATKGFVKDILPIRDNLSRALDQENGDVRSGVELTAREFDKLLNEEGVTIIEPSAGDDVDPKHHEVLSRVDSDVEQGQIVECYRAGYTMDDTIIRPARVTVSDE